MSFVRTEHTELRLAWSLHRYVYPLSPPLWGPLTSLRTDKYTLILTSQKHETSEIVGNSDDYVEWHKTFVVRSDDVVLLHDEYTDDDDYE